jgi:hypothetical protein
MHHTTWYHPDVSSCGLDPGCPPLDEDPGFESVPPLLPGTGRLSNEGLGSYVRAPPVLKCRRMGKMWGLQNVQYHRRTATMTYWMSERRRSKRTLRDDREGP